ncbi:MAG: acyl-CoA dehydrogenase family protein [Phycisphaerales bacterium JB039]
MADLKSMKGVSERDRKLIEDAETLLGPEPESMGFMKNLFWGNLREDQIFPHPDPVSAQEKAECDQLLAELEDYLRNEHPAVRIDQEEEIPRSVIDRLFKIGVLGMTIPKQYGGLGMGITSYNRMLELIGKYCGSTAVVVSAHLSIGCGAIKLFGTEEQKQKWLPKLATEWLSAFCLSEPNVGCDAGGQETTCHLTEDGEYYIVNGEKKWATSGALSAIFTVMAKQKFPDGKEKITALVCTPDMPGVEIFEKNRSKCGIRGTWQARIRFTNARVPKANLLHKEGKGLNVALTCLNYGRCTLSAGMLGGAQRVKDQGTKWALTRLQFGRPIADFELVQQRVARMAALTYAMDAVLYMTTAFLDRGDTDIMVETATCKVFVSEMGWKVVNDGMQIMGGECYMTENEVERVFRDSRLNMIVEGANEVMQSFIFAYGGKQLAESMLGVQEAIQKKRFFSPTVMRAALPLAAELYLGVRRRRPRITKVDPSLAGHAERLCRLTQEHSHQFKQASRRFAQDIISRQVIQARIADVAMWLFAYACTLSKLDQEIRAHGSNGGVEFARDRAAAEHFFDLAEQEINACFRGLYENADKSMLKSATAALKHNETLPNELFIVPEKSPVAMGTGRPPARDGVRQFPGDAAAPDAPAAHYAR